MGENVTKRLGLECNNYKYLYLKKHKKAMEGYFVCSLCLHVKLYNFISLWLSQIKFQCQGWVPAMWIVISMLWQSQGQLINYPAFSLMAYWCPKERLSAYEIFSSSHAILPSVLAPSSTNTGKHVSYMNSFFWNVIRSP